MIIVPSRGKVDSYAGLKTKIDETIGAINGKYSTINWTPVYYFYHGFDFEELAAMYYIADIALVTPLRDGMNLVAKEYLAAKRDNPGVLILSEMAGAAIELREAIIVNPNDVSEIERSILQALEMPEEEQFIKLHLMQKDISRQTVDKWATDFVHEVHKIRALNEKLSRKRIEGSILKQIQQSYKDSRKRLLILDYDGTLCAFCSNPEDAVPTQELMDILKRLSADKKNKLVVSSGRDHQTLDKWFGRLPVDLAAEHGAFYKEDGVWHENIPVNQWDDEILSILNSFIDKTPHSKLEEKETALVWHYRNVDSWLGDFREQQLINALIDPCARRHLQIMRGDKIVEIKSPLYTKGSEARRLLQNNRFDFILAMGDDITDEDTFRELPADAFTIKVGNISEIARYSLWAQSQVLPFLKWLLVR